VVLFRSGEDEFVVAMRALEKVASITEHEEVAKYVRAGTQRNAAEYRALIARLPSPPEGATLADMAPGIAQQWNFERNAPLVPSLFSAGSDQQVFWQCVKGHVWSATIKNRTLRGSGCPKCAAETHSDRVRAARVRKGGSIVETTPHLVARWDFERNTATRPEDVARKSMARVWWRCEDGHSYRRPVGDETKAVHCPQCFRENRASLAQRAAAAKRGTLAEAIKGLPVTLVEPGVSAGQLSARGRRALMWQCVVGHTFRREARDVVKHPGCPRCKSPTLAEKRPDLVLEWAEPGLSPMAVAAGSSRKVRWRCLTCGHEWRAAVIDRTGQRSGCPLCARAKAAENTRLAKLRKSGSVAARFPSLVAEWHPTRNTPLLPEDISPGSHVPVWWRCGHGHEWRTSPNQRIRRVRITGCQQCSRSGPRSLR
jgi:hypothetical protein